MVSYLTYDSSFITTIYHQLPVLGYVLGEEDISSDYREKMDVLRHYDERMLLIIDNFDSYITDNNQRVVATSDPQYNEICSGKYHIIFVSNNTFEGSMLLAPLPEAQQVDLFLYHYKRSLSNEEMSAVQELLRRIGGHTLTIILLAKALFVDRRKSINGFLEQIASDAHGISEVLSSALVSAFDVSSLSDSEKYIMINMSLTPSDGISVRNFGDWIGLNEFEELQSLIDFNWIQFDTKKDSISLHPVVSDLVAHSLKSDYAKCARYLESLISFSGCEKNADSLEKRQYSTKLIKAALMKITDDDYIIGKLVYNNINYNHNFDTYIGESAGWGPRRDTFQWAEGAPFRTFNSITDNPSIGDERNFVRVRKVGDPKFVDGVVVEPGIEYEVAVYFHNNASRILNESGKGVAAGARVSSILPSFIAAKHKSSIIATITAANTSPVSIWGSTSINTDADVYIQFIPNSATIHSNGTVNGKNVGQRNLFSAKGAYLGYDDDAWGILPGGNKYSGYISYRFCVVQPGFEIEKKVSKDGANEWVDALSAEPGEVVDFKIQYSNTGMTQQSNVIINDDIPDELEYLEGTTFLINGSSPDGKLCNDNLFKQGFNIGRYQPGSGATISYKARVSCALEVKCSNSIITNKAIVATANGKKEDVAEVTIKSMKLETGA